MRPDLTQHMTAEWEDAKWEREHTFYYQQLRQHYMIVEQYLYGSVLDIGCGPGYLGMAAPGEYTGIDISPKAIELARESSCGKFLVHDAEYSPLPFPDQGFDTVVASELLEHLLNHGLLLEEMRRVARAYIVITVPISMGGCGHVWPQWTYRDVIAKFGCLGSFIEIRRFFDPPHKFNLCYIRARGEPTKESLLR